MVYELRQYTLHPGARDTLIELFDREFVESQDAVGAHVVGQFRDLDAQDRFVWLRKFRDMEARRAALAAFYGGPVWKEHSHAANATMIDSDDVLLLRPTSGAFTQSDRPPVTATPTPGALYSATICPVEPGFAAYFQEQVAPALTAAGMPPIAAFETEHAENTFPALPVRAGENVFVWFTRFERPEAYRDPASLLDPHRLTGTVQRLRLAPTTRSAVR